ncbi:MAG: chemotaxis protein CheA [Lachnospiraceae bacterium]|nr:chemotaxis protein CheA [Lachnospiraceae bacterium]
MDVSQYLEMFIDESKEHIQTLSDELMVLEKEPENIDTINEIFRAAHSLKGMAGTMGYKRMQRLTHDMENVFQEIRSDNMKVVPELVDVLFDALDAVSNYLDNIIESADEGVEENEGIINALNKIVEKATGKSNSSEESTVTKPVNSDNKSSESSSDKAPADNSNTINGSGNNTPSDNNSDNPSGNDDGHDYRNIRLSEFEKKSFRDVIEDGTYLLGLTVYLSTSCVLKSARSFLVFKVLEDNGEVLKSVPNIQDIEDEKFDFDFSVIYLSNVPADKIQSLVRNVSEVERVCVGDVIDMVEDRPKEEKSSSEAPSNKDISTHNKDENVSKGHSEEHNTNKTSDADKKVVVMHEGGAQAQVKEKSSDKSGKSAKSSVGRTVRVDIEKLDDLMNLVSELIIAKNGLVSINSNRITNNPADNIFNEQIEYLESVTTNLHESVMKVRMVPIETIFSRFPRLMRDLSKKLNKKIEFHVSGGETELDRTVIDEIGDPLQHLLRNAADHGLETTDERIKSGKTEEGNVYLNAYQVGNNIVIEVKDDGAGMNLDKIKKKAIEKGLVTEEVAEMISDEEVVDFLFKPGFSTADKISDISGRGVGLDVVKTKIEELGGSIECKTVFGEGTTFVIKLPLTLAIIQTLMVELKDEKYAIPLGNIQTIEDIPHEDIKHLRGKEVINLRGRVIPIIRLNDVLEVPDNGFVPESLTVVIVEKGDRVAGLVVDNLVGQQESVIKPIGDYISGSRAIGGATILGNGEIALILEVNALF